VFSFLFVIVVCGGTVWYFANKSKEQREEFVQSFFDWIVIDSLYNVFCAALPLAALPTAFYIYNCGVPSLLVWLRTRTRTSAAQAPPDEESRHMIERDDRRSD
jgi:hypothetical protein